MSEVLTAVATETQVQYPRSLPRGGTLFEGAIIVVEPRQPLTFEAYKKLGGRFEASNGEGPDKDFDRAQKQLSKIRNGYNINIPAQSQNQGLFDFSRLLTGLADRFGLPAPNEETTSLFNYFRNFQILEQDKKGNFPNTEADRLLDGDLLRELYLLEGDIDSYKKIPPSKTVREGTVLSSPMTGKIVDHAVYGLKELLLVGGAF